MIDTNMKIIFTGAKTNNEKLFNSILDGEYIQKNKVGEIINLYAAFDVYYINKKDVDRTNRNAIKKDTARLSDDDERSFFLSSVFSLTMSM